MVMRRLPQFLLFFTLSGIFLSGCSQDNTTRVLLTGSSTVAPLMTEMATQFSKQNPQFTVQVQAGGSSRGVADVRRGLTQVGMASRALKANESDVVAHTIAYDGIAMILHQSNPISKLSDTQIKKVYLGRLKNWSELLGGEDKAIVVVSKAAGHSTLELFLDYFTVPESDIAAHIIVGDNQHALQSVATNPNAIGYVSIGSAIFEKKNGLAIKVLGLGGVEASLAIVQSGQYPLLRPLNLLTFGEPSAAAKALIAFSQSTAAWPMIEAQFFTPVKAIQ